MNFPRPKTLRMSLTSVSSCMSSTSTPINHYDTLKVAHNATQEEIKTAYYKLTKVYHPDVNKTEEAKGKFRIISEAYEILGNYKARKKYDRGIVARGATTVIYREEKDDPHAAFYKSRMDKYPKPVRKGDSKIYDFDAWTRAHYGDTLKRTLNRKETNRDVQLLKDNIPEDNAQSLRDAQLAIGLAIAMILLVIFLETKENFDDILEKRKKIKKES